MSEIEEFTGGSSYISGGNAYPGDPELANGGEEKAVKCSKTVDYILAGFLLVAVIAIIVIVVMYVPTSTDKLNTANDRLRANSLAPVERLSVTVTEDPKERATVTITDDEKFVSDGQYSQGQVQSDADIQMRHEVYGRMNNVSSDPAVQKVVGSYSDFSTANNPVVQGKDQARKGMNHSDSGSNRFAGSESHPNQEGSLWQKPVQQGSFVERMSAGSHNDWTGRYSESSLDPNRVYVENNAVGQPMYSWGLSPARGPRGKTDLLLGAAAAGL